MSLQAWLSHSEAQAQHRAALHKNLRMLLLPRPALHSCRQHWAGSQWPDSPQEGQRSVGAENPPSGKQKPDAGERHPKIGGGGDGRAQTKAGQDPPTLLTLE